MTLVRCASHFPRARLGIWELFRGPSKLGSVYFIWTTFEFLTHALGKWPYGTLFAPFSASDLTANPLSQTRGSIGA